MTQENKTPRVYVVCLGAYNNGELHGIWIDCTGDESEFWLGIFDLLSTSPEPEAEDWEVHDFENWHGLKIDKHQSVEEICNWSKLIIKYGKPIASFIRWAKQMDIAVSSNEFKSRYYGHFKSGEEFALLSKEVEKRYHWNDFVDKFPFWSGCISWKDTADYLETTNAYRFINAKESEGHGVYVFRYVNE